MNERKAYTKQGEKDDVIKYKPTMRQCFAEVVLGRASSNCKNFGICRIEEVTPERIFYHVSDCYEKECRVYAIASAKEGAYFELAFLRSTVGKKIFEQHFSSSIFIVEETYTVKEDFIQHPMTVKVGSYNIAISDTFLVVRFDVS